MTLLLLGEGCPGVQIVTYSKRYDEDEDIILLAYSLMADYEPDRKPTSDN